MLGVVRIVLGVVSYGIRGELVAFNAPLPGSWLRLSSGEAEFSLEAEAVSSCRMSCLESLKIATGVGEQ